MLAAATLVLVRIVRAFGLTTLGAVGGMAAAAALVKRVVPSRGDEESDEVALVAAFDGVNLRSRARAFRGGSMLAWFGGIAVDLRDATLAPDARLSVHTVFGGIAVRVPPGWRLESSVNAIAGGVDTRELDADDPAAPTLRLEGFALFGGIAVGAKTAEAAFES
jgi:hypothetical protein